MSRRRKADAAPESDALHPEGEAETVEAEGSAKDAAAPSQPPVLPLVRNEEGWHIDASELTPDCPLWGPYETKAEANEDRRPSFVRRVREQRRQQKRALTKKPKPV